MRNDVIIDVFVIIRVSLIFYFMLWVYFIVKFGFWYNYIKMGWLILLSYIYSILGMSKVLCKVFKNIEEINKIVNEYVSFYFYYRKMNDNRNIRE